MSGGLLLALQGGLAYWRLVALPAPVDAARLALDAPGVGEGVLLEAVDLAGAVGLGWAALALLPHSHPLGAPRTLAVTAHDRALLTRH